MFHYGLMAMPDMGIKNTKEKEVFFRAAWKLDETINTDNYADTVNALDSTGFKEYYNLIGAFAKKYKIANWQDYNEYEPVLIEHLNEELGRHEKTEEKLELINSFHDEELCSETFPSASKIRVLYDILDDCFVLGNKENGINRILRTFNENDKTAFITKIQSDDKLLASFIKKVNGGEKDEMLATIGEIFISSGFIKDRKTVLLDNKKTDTLTASLNKGKIYIKMESLAESTNLVPGGMGDYPNISRRTVTVSPFDIVRMYYDGRLINVPALLLLNSWSNSMAEPEGLFYNYRHEDIDWNSLSDEKKDEYFSEFVKHYLPSGFVEALGNPIQLVITGIITVGLAIATGGASIAAELEVAMAAAGIALSAASAVGSIRGVLTANEMKQAAQTTHEAKKAAKFMAECIAKLTVDVINVILIFMKSLKGKQKKKILKETKRESNTINPNDIRFSQSSVNGSSPIVESMKRNGWQGDPIDVVQMADGRLITIDNTRVVAARQARIDVQANIHAYDELLPIEYIARFTTKKGVPKTWGDAVELRIGKQKSSFRTDNLFGSIDMMLYINWG